MFMLKNNVIGLREEVVTLKKFEVFALTKSSTAYGVKLCLEALFYLFELQRGYFSAINSRIFP